MKLKRLNPFFCIVALCLLAMAMIAAAGVGRGAFAQGSGLFAGDPYGEADSGTVKVGNVISAGPLFVATSGCSTSASQTDTAAGNLTLLGTNVLGLTGNLISNGTLTNTVTITRTATSGTATAESNIQNLQLLGVTLPLVGNVPLVGINAVDIKATTTGTASGTTSSVAFTLASLNVLGTAVTLPNPIPANYKVPLVSGLLNLGTIILNEQKPLKDGSGISANAIHITLLPGTILNSGTSAIDITLGHVKTQFTAKPVNPTVSAKAYGVSVKANVGPLSTLVGEIGEVAIGCTQSGTKTNTQVGVNIPGVLTTGTITDTATTNGLDTASSSSTVQNVNLLGTVVQATLVTSSASISPTGGRTGSASIGSLSIGGTPITIPLVNGKIPANTKITVIPGLTITLNEQSPPASKGVNKIMVNAIHIKVGASAVLGLPANADIIIAHSEARVTP